MCDMQNMPTSDDACEEEEDMNFATFSTAGPTAGTNFVASGTQMPMAKLQQGVAGNGLEMMVVGGMDVNGMQYIRTVDAGNAVGSLQSTPHLITLPIALPGSKPGDPQQTVQIQVLNPNIGMQQQQQPKFMQIPIQSFQQGMSTGGTVLTVAYSPEANEGFQLLQGPEGIQVIMPQDMQMLQQDNKDHVATSLAQQIYVQNQQIVVNSAPDKMLNNNTSCNNNNQDVKEGLLNIKEECDDITNDDESSQGTDGTNDSPWLDNQTISSYILNTQPKLQQQQTLPVSLQQFLRLNPTDKEDQPEDVKNEDITEAVLTNDGTIKIKKKRKYKKRPPKPARPKPGQVIIAKSNDGTTIFCCPECQMAFPEKLQLEMHLSVHKIERRFICGICGAGLKRKEHLERHKLGHNPERPYVCAVCRKGFKRREHLNLHTVIHSGVKTEVCVECGKGFYRKDHLRKHARSHVTKRAKEGTAGGTNTGLDSVTITKTESIDSNTILPEITIHVPTSANVQVPVQINIPQHVMSSLAAQQAAQANANNNSNNILDALLAQHT